ncbi:hypothetical protein JCM8097_003369 [Rhodosporidiobolus ruineniae]
MPLRLSDLKHRETDSIVSIALSPVTASAYSESDPFLSPALSPKSPYLRPSSPRHSFSSRSSLSASPLPSPRLGDEHSHSGFFEHIHIPPSAKRTRSRTWLFVAAGSLFLLVCVGLSSSGVADEKIGLYATRPSNGLQQMRGMLVGEAGGSGPEALVLQVDEAEEEGELPAQIPISMLPRPRSPDKEDEDARYIGFLPHSGYHNQRIVLQNALLLGKILNRTVLLPPVWVGWPVPTQYMDELRQSWLDIMLLNPSSFNLSTLVPSSPINIPGAYHSSALDFPCPACDADNSTLLDERHAANEAKKAKWVEMGYEVRPDGYPIVPGLDASNCKSYSPECRFTYRDSFLAWDSLVDIDRARSVGVEVVDRWDMRERALEDLLDVKPEDVVSSGSSSSGGRQQTHRFLLRLAQYVVEDRRAYDFRFLDRLNSSTPLITDNTANKSHWHRDVSLQTLAAYPHKVLLVGSLFGSGRVVSSSPDAHAWQEAFGRAMAFKNPYLLRPAEAIVARLGGQSNFVGVHARVGDGGFLREAKKNCETVWRKLVGQKMGVKAAVLEEMWERVKPETETEVEAHQEEKQKRSSHGRRGHREKIKRRAAHHGEAVEQSPLRARSPWSLVDDEYHHDNLVEEASSLPAHSKRSILDWFSQPVDPSSRLRNLTCRGELHTDHRLRAFNTPLYLATDSRSPETDPNLRPFFAAFPCTFILSDFDRPDAARNDGLVVRSVNEMGRLVNELDGVPLGRLFLPFLEAIIAAKGWAVSGTPHSTFSGFAEGELHRAYWDVVTSKLAYPIDPQLQSSSNMASKEAVVNALNELSNAYGVLKKAHGHAQSAINEYAQQINQDPSLLSQFPNIFGQLAGGLQGGDEKPEKRRRGPNKEKKVKDPNAPKRPPSAYIEYQNSVREEFRKQYADLPYSEVLKKIGLVWQNMSDSEKKPWNEITEEKKSLYQDNKAAYEAEHGTGKPVASTSQATPEAPKKRGRPKKEETEAKAREAAAKVVSHIGDIPVEDIKEKKKKASPKASKKAAAPPSSDESESDDDSEDDSDDSEESSESEEEAAPPAKKSKKDKKRK